MYSVIWIMYHLFFFNAIGIFLHCVEILLIRRTLIVFLTLEILVWWLFNRAHQQLTISKTMGFKGCALSLNLFMVTFSLWVPFASNTFCQCSSWSVISQKPIFLDEFLQMLERSLQFCISCAAVNHMCASKLRCWCLLATVQARPCVLKAKLRCWLSSECQS